LTPANENSMTQFTGEKNLDGSSLALVLLGYFE
jgi:hypothetical protein